MSRIHIVAHGDVKLLLEDGLRVRVSAVVLSCASPVFEALLSSRYLEGQGERSAEQPKEIVLDTRISRPLWWICAPCFTIADSRILRT